MRRALAAVCAALLLLSGCRSNSSLLPLSSERLTGTLESGLRLAVEAPASGWIDVDFDRDGAAMLQSGQQASQGLNSAAQGAANAGAAGGPQAALGMLAGSLLVGHLAQSAERDNAHVQRKRIAPIDARIPAQSWAEHYRDAYARALSNLGYAHDPHAVSVLNVRPQIIFSKDLQSLRVISELSLQSASETLYRARVESYSSAFECEDCVSSWLAHDGQRLYELVDELVRDSAFLVVSDWQSKHFAGQREAQRTLRFQLGSVWHVERGYPLRLESGRSVFLSLRGWIKSFPSTAEVR